MTAPERVAWARATFLNRLGTITKAELLALDRAVDDLVAEGGDEKHLRKGFFFAWYHGPKLTAEDEGALNALFVDVLVAIARGITDVDAWAMTKGRATSQRPGLLGSLLEVFSMRSPSREVEDLAIKLIEGAVMPFDPRVAIVSAWNAACAVVLHGRLDATTDEVLGAAWRRTIGDLPA
jgi:hypothetical protein